MRIRTLLVLLAITLVAAFTVNNWPAFAAPTALSLGFVTFQAPLGLVMIALLVTVTVAFAIYMAVWQGTILMDTRRHAKELQLHRTLSDQAEASRFTELRGVMQAELETMAGRIKQSEEALRADIRESANSLAAMFAEMDDRMKRPRNGDAG